MTAALAPHQEWPPLELPALTLDVLRAYADASGDHAAVHLDEENARSHGFPTAIAHGLLAMAWLGRAVTDHVPPERLKNFSVRFIAPVFLGEKLACRAAVVASGEGETIIGLELVDETGQLKIKGEARVHN